jgi:hypothetical protein
MKKFIEVQEVKVAGLEALGGKHVLLFCMNYIYTGVLRGVNSTFVLLENPKIVYATGAFTSKTFEDAQPLPFEQCIQIAAIESFGETDKR